MFSKKYTDSNAKEKTDESGAALAISVITLAILAVIAMTALAFSSTEARIAGSDLQRTQTFYAASTGLEKMTNDFSNLFREKLNPTDADLLRIANDPPSEMRSEGFDFSQTIAVDEPRLTQLRNTQGLPANIFPRVNIPEGPYAGLYASLVPYKISSIATMSNTGTQIKLEREFNNYLVPLFQFGIFSNDDLEFHPGPLMTFNGRVHANENIYALRNTKFLKRITMGGEWIRAATRGGEANTASGADNVYVESNGISVHSTVGSMITGSGIFGGPQISGSRPGSRGYFPTSPLGLPNASWETESVKPAANGVDNRFGGQIMTHTTGATQLKLPVETGGNNAAELIKRSLPSDNEMLSSQRYHKKAQVRILIDDETAGSGTGNVAGIPNDKGLKLSQFVPSVLNGDGNVLKQISNSGTITGNAVQQRLTNGNLTNAKTVRGIKAAADTSTANYIPQGAGIQGKILIEVVKPDGTTVDVTRTILSMGVTEGEPNGIVYLQRPLWAAYVQGSRDRRGNGFDLVNLTRNYQHVADGELLPDPNAITPLLYPNRGFINTTPSNVNEDAASGKIIREVTPIGEYNKIVPINVYNVREGWYQSQMSEYNIYERGVTSVVELNMRNLARWLDGIYDANLLSGTNAVSSNIKGDEGYVIYVSDRRGDRIKPEYLNDGTSYASTNGIVDNEDIYGPNNTLDDGEDVIDFGWEAGGLSKKGRLQKDTAELPATGTVWTNAAGRLSRSNTVLGWATLSTSTSSFFRRSVRLFDGETLSFNPLTAGKLSPTKGISVSSENLIYIWGNYNTTGVSSIPTDGSTLNDGTGFTGNQIPASIVGDAFSPLSRTWFDALSALFPEGSSDPRNFKGEAYRMADEGASVTEGTAVRAGIIAGTNISTLTRTPGRDAAGLRRGGGIINYPRFLECWNLNNITKPWSYAGSFIPLYHSTQMVANWENDTSIIYMPPRRNWSFDDTFLTPNKLPPGTPFFQYVQATGFRQSIH